MTECVQYQQWGKPDAARQILLLHGWGMNSGVWTGIAQTLDKVFSEYRILAVDLPGYGQSRSCDRQALGGAYNTHSIADKLSRLLQGRQTVLLAWSMGGLVALDMLKQWPKAITQLILVSSSPRFVQGDDWPDAVKARVFEDFYQSLEDDHQATLKRFLAIQAMGSPSARQDIKMLQQQLQARGEADPQALKYGLKILLNEDKRQQLLQTGNVPISLIAGERDTLVPVKALQTLAQQDNIRLYAIAEAGHAPFISHPETFINRLQQVINKDEA